MESNEEGDRCGRQWNTRARLHKEGTDGEEH